MLNSVSPQLSPSGSYHSGAHYSQELEAQLEAQFNKGRNPHPTDMALLAAETGLDEREVQAWFAHRLACWRREQGLSSNIVRPYH